MKYVAVVAVVFVALVAAARPSGAQVPSFQVEQFEPMPTQRTNTLNIARSDVVPHLEPGAGVLFHYVDDPLQLVDPTQDSVDTRVVGGQLKAEVWAGLGLFEMAEIGLIVPTVLYQHGEELNVFGAGGQDIDGVALGDMRLVPKLRLPIPRIGGVGFALTGPIYLPTGGRNSFNSDGTVRWEPRLVIDWRMNGFLLATNLAYQFRPETVAHNYVSNDVVRWGVATEVPLGVDEVVSGVVTTPRFISSLFGTVGLSDDVDPRDPSRALDRSVGSPVELLAGFRVGLPAHLGVTLGGGAGLNDHVGAPDWRLFLSIGFVSTERDSDEDGLPDLEDQCPHDPEDYDEYKDADGCPDHDNDGDGIADAADECPNEPEDADDFEDTDGCPEPDNDGDGILDDDDECPMVPGIPEQNGCPDNDPDRDGVPDPQDKCPEEPEDVDGFQDDDGCPDPDNDGDNILDVDDQCPDEAETVNNIDDEDGCPDSDQVRLTAEKIEINERVYFDTGQATIQARSYPILNEVAAALRDHPNITRVRIEGHTDDRGSDDFNIDLSQRRAEAVRAYLIAQGIEESRLSAVGYGERIPIESNATEEGRARNRRVEFKILERDSTPNQEGTQQPQQQQQQQQQQPQ